MAFHPDDELSQLLRIQQDVGDLIGKKILRRMRQLRGRDIFEEDESPPQSFKKSLKCALRLKHSYKIKSKGTSFNQGHPSGSKIVYQCSRCHKNITSYN